MKKLLHFIKKNYYLLALAFLIFFVSAVSLYKISIVKPTYIYAKVKLGQGLWWASTAEPPLWLVNSLSKKANNSDIKIEKINYYPYYISGTNAQIINQNNDQYKVYITLKLKVTTNKTADVFYFNRSVIAIGSPIDLAFPNVQVSGVVIDYSKQPIIDSLTDKVIFLTKSNPDDWEYEAIKIGDYYFDGKNKVFEILDKEILDNGNALTIKAKIKLKMINGQFVFGEDRIVTVGKNINIFTNNFSFYGYLVSLIK